MPARGEPGETARAAAPPAPVTPGGGAVVSDTIGANVKAAAAAAVIAMGAPPAIRDVEPQRARRPAAVTAAAAP